MSRHLRVVADSERHPCSQCLARAWLLGRLAGHLDTARASLDDALALSDLELIDALGGSRRAEIRAQYDALEPTAERARATEAGLELVCRCQPEYPAGLLASPTAPAVLHLGGARPRRVELLGGEAVAIVGSRRGSEYGREVARSLARGVSSAGVTVISGMATGIDAAAHAGALSAGGVTVAVLPGGADRPYPPAKRELYNSIIRSGAVLSELPPGCQVRRWMFPARNRIIAALSAITIVVEATEHSGALITARYAEQLERPVAAVPGRVSSPLAAGPNELLRRGAELIRGPQDILDALFGAGSREAGRDRRGPLEPELERLLSAIAAEHDTVGALARAGLDPQRGLAALSALELAGYVRRAAGGRYCVVS